jgi:hypothetical protein
MHSSIASLGRVGKTWFVAAALLAGTLQAASPDGTAGTPELGAPMQQGLRILVTGHSFHMGMPPHLTEAALAAGLKDHKIVASQGIGGSRVIQHWKLPDERNKAKAALKTGQIDVMTMAPHRRHPDEGIDKFVELALQHNPAIRITVQQSWGPWDDGDARPKLVWDRNALTGEILLAGHANYFREFEEQIEAVNKKCGRQVLFTVPVGRAVIALREQIRLKKAPGLTSQDELFTDLMGHPAAPVTALSAYCHFAVIYRRNPSDLPMLSLIAKTRNPERAALDRLLKAIAWEAVIKHPQSGVRAATASK